MISNGVWTFLVTFKFAVYDFQASRLLNENHALTKQVRDLGANVFALESELSVSLQERDKLVALHLNDQVWNSRMIDYVCFFVWNDQEGPIPHPMDQRKRQALRLRRRSVPDERGKIHVCYLIQGKYMNWFWSIMNDRTSQSFCLKSYLTCFRERSVRLSFSML